MLNERNFTKQFDILRAWIRDSVAAFEDDSPGAQQERISKAASDRLYFVRTYLPHYLEDDFAPVHSELFKLSDTKNTPVVIVGTRELAKSTIISFFDELHKTLFKLNRFTIFICDTQETAASEFLLPLRAELEENQRIIMDFGSQRTQYWNLDDFTTKSGKRTLALGPKMGAKGKRHKASRPDRIIVEDFENINSSKKKSIIKRRLKYLLSDVMKSVNFKSWQFIFIGNYFSKKTIVHQLLTADEFKHWSRKIYPALIPANSKLSTSKGKSDKLVSIWESRLPLKKLLDERTDDPFTFRTERMQKPDDEEAKFKEEWIQYFDINDIAGKNLPVVTYFDPSAGRGEEHCYKAIIAIAVDKENAINYVIFASINKLGKFRNVELHFDISERFKSIVDGVESNGFQSTLEEDYDLISKMRGTRINLKLINNRLSKEDRILRLESPIYRGHLKFIRPKGFDGVSSLIEQLIDFPDGEFVDGPDALAGAVEVANSYILKKSNQVKAKVL